jgi:diguanylate cyclase (GGDEF)-like protein/PAS domain S-box-containing protein
MTDRDAWRTGGGRPPDPSAGTRVPRDEAGGADRILRNPSRVAALREADLLDTPSEEVFDRLTRLAAKALEAPVSLFTLIDEHRQFCKSVVGLPDVWVSGRDSPLSYSFCQHAVAMGVPLVIEDARKHPLVRQDPATMRGVIAYAGVPLVTSDGHALGTLCVIDFQPRKWSDGEVQTLAELAAVVVTKIELRSAVRAAEHARSALRESEGRFRTAFEMAPIGMALVAIDGRWIRVNRALTEIVGYTREELLAGTFQDITHPEDLGAELANLERLLSGELDSGTAEGRYIHRDGHPVWIQRNTALIRDDAGEPLHFITQVQDITERKREEERLRTLSFLDELTGLYNRRAFLAMAAERLKLAKREGRRLLLLYIDLDGLKEINEARGQAAGDGALRATGDALRRTFRESDLIARIGGDEFAILAALSETDAPPLLDRFRQRLGPSLARDDEPRPINISVGAATFEPGEPCTINELIARADALMSQDRASGRQG